MKYPRWSPVIRFLASIPVTRAKTLWNVLRRLRANGEQLVIALRKSFQKPAPDQP